jgi:hypothetical protein
MTLGNSARPAPWTIIGYRKDGRPIHLLAGGSAAEDDEDDSGIDLGADGDEDETDEGADEEAEPDDEAEEEKPKPKPKPAAKGPTDADLKRVTGALDKERAAAKTARATVRELQAELRVAKKAAEPKAGDDEAVVKAVEEARTEAEARFKPMIVGKAARFGLVAAGLAPDTSEDRMKRLLKMIDMSDVDLDEDGEVSGLEDQIDQIKDTLPELFRKPEPEAPAPKPRAPKIDAADRKNAQPAPKSTGEKHAAAILGNL